MREGRRVQQGEATSRAALGKGHRGATGEPRGCKAAELKGLGARVPRALEDWVRAMWKRQGAGVG